MVIFNTVMNTLLDTVSLRLDLGYQFSNSNCHVNILQYADDTCLVADSPASGQFLLNIVSDWLQWSGMVAKIPKRQCLALQASTGKLVDPHLSLNGVPITFSADPSEVLGDALVSVSPSIITTGRPARFEFWELLNNCGLGFKLPRGARLCSPARVKSSVDDRLQIMSMAQNTPLPNITDFLTSSSRVDRECTEERDGSSPPKRNKHRETFEFPWVRYVAPDQEDRPCMLYTLGHELSKRMVWLIIPCKLLRKDRLREYQRSWCKQT